MLKWASHIIKLILLNKTNKFSIAKCFFKFSE